MTKPLSPLRLLLMALALVLLYAWQVEPRLLTVHRVVVRDPVLAKAWSGLTIVHLSDLHIARLGRYEARILAAVRRLKPDLILLSGDYRQWHRDPGPAQDFLARLAAPLGVYGVLGDADQGPSRAGCAYCHPQGNYQAHLSSPYLLQNEVRTLAWQGRTIRLAGIDFGVEGEEWGQTLRTTIDDQAGPLVVMSHRSTLWNDLPPAHVLWLSGDTHGGQLRLPAWLWQCFPYKPDPAHMGGLYRNGHGGWLLVNRGLGETSWLPFRLGVPPEIDVITFAEP